MKSELLTCMDGIGLKAEAAAAAAAMAAAAGEGASDVDEEGGNEAPHGAEAAAGKMVMCLGATNIPWDLDDAFKRRFEKRIYIPLPGVPERAALFRLCLAGLPLDPALDFHALGLQTEHFSGADVAAVAKHASFAPMRRKQAEVMRLFPKPDQIKDRVAAIKGAEAAVKAEAIGMADLLEALRVTNPSASSTNLKMFETYAAEHGST
jgi:SpoVK/Ycf46/Vps4 family AAA+-type ATPase